MSVLGMKRTCSSDIDCKLGTLCCRYVSLLEIGWESTCMKKCKPPNERGQRKKLQGNTNQYIDCF